MSSRSLHGQSWLLLLLHQVFIIVLKTGCQTRWFAHDPGRDHAEGGRNPLLTRLYPELKVAGEPLQSSALPCVHQVLVVLLVSSTLFGVRHR